VETPNVKARNIIPKIMRDSGDEDNRRLLDADRLRTSTVEDTADINNIAYNNHPVGRGFLSELRSDDCMIE
jgi:hypothetical protein